MHLLHDMQSTFRLSSSSVSRYLPVVLCQVCKIRLFTTYLLRSGCSVAQLWPLLERNKEALGTVTLNEAVKQALWCCLLQRLTDIHVYQDYQPSSQENRSGRRAFLLPR